MSLIKRSGITIYNGNHVGVRTIKTKRSNNYENDSWEREVLSSCVELGDYDYNDCDINLSDEIAEQLWGVYKHDCPTLVSDFNDKYFSRS